MAKVKNPAQSSVKLCPELVKDIVECVKNTLREEETRIIEERHDRKRGNIKLLLKKYRDLCEYVNHAVYEAAQASEDLNLHAILEMMGSRGKSFRLESMLANVTAARLLLEHTNSMLDRYRATCEESGSIEDMRRCRVIWNLYISDERMTVEELADEENTNERTIYRDIDKACERLAVLFFGAYGLKFL